MTQEKLKINDYYSSADLALVTVLSLFYPIDSIDRQNPYKATFLFKRDAQLDQLIESYWKGELRVNPLAYFNQLKTIKARLYGEK